MMNKILATKINLYALKLSGRKCGGICMSMSMLNKLREPSKTYVEVETLIKCLREINNEENEDDFHAHEAISDFIAELEGILIEHADDKKYLEWT